MGKEIKNRDMAKLRAMATVENVKLVVINTKSGPNVASHEKHRPPDSVHVYWPERAGKGLLKIAKTNSWACDIVPALLKERESGDNPSFRVILHNGEPPSSENGHFEATRSTL